MNPVSGGIAIASWLSSTSRSSVVPVPIEPMTKIGPLPGAGCSALIAAASLWPPLRDEPRQRLADGVDTHPGQLVHAVLEAVAGVVPVDQVDRRDAGAEERGVIVHDLGPVALRELPPRAYRERGPAHLRPQLGRRG